MGASLSLGRNRHPRPTWSMVLRCFLAILGPICLFLQLFGDDYLRGGNFRAKLCKPSLCIRADFLRVDADGGRAPALRKSLSLDFRTPAFSPLSFLGIKFMSDRLRRTLFDAATASRDVALLANRFDAALNNMPHGLCMFDSEGRIVVSNQGRLS